MTTIAYTLFRESVSNDDIIQLNQYVRKLATEHGISIIDINEVVAKDDLLDYQYTNDGLHLNKRGQGRVNQLICQAVVEEN